MGPSNEPTEMLSIEPTRPKDKSILETTSDVNIATTLMVESENDMTTAILIIIVGSLSVFASIIFCWYCHRAKKNNSKHVHKGPVADVSVEIGANTAQDVNIINQTEPRRATIPGETVTSGEEEVNMQIDGAIDNENTDVEFRENKSAVLTSGINNDDLAQSGIQAGIDEDSNSKEEDQIYDREEGDEASVYRESDSNGSEPFYDLFAIKKETNFYGLPNEQNDTQQ